MKFKEFEEGKLVEEDIKNYLTNVTTSTKEQDIHEHWDLMGDFENLTQIKIDVKSVKKDNRYDILPNENHHWVELKNVNGKLGWLFGQADYIAFETFDYYILVERTKLIDFLRVKCEGKEIGNKKNLYEKYRREGRKDVVVKVKTIDLMVIMDKLIKKIEKS